MHPWIKCVSCMKSLCMWRFKCIPRSLISLVTTECVVKYRECKLGRQDTAYRSKLARWNGKHIPMRYSLPVNMWFKTLGANGVHIYDHIDDLIITGSHNWPKLQCNSKQNTIVFFLEDAFEFCRRFAQAPMFWPEYWTDKRCHLRGKSLIYLYFFILFIHFRFCLRIVSDIICFSQLICFYVPRVLEWVLCSLERIWVVSVARCVYRPSNANIRSVIFVA